MSVDMYRRQVTQLREGIAKLMEQKAREVQRSADASKKAISAQSAAGRSTSTATIQSKLREAIRNAEDQSKHEKEVARFERKIAEEQKKLGVAQGRLDDEEAKIMKKRNEEQKRLSDEQQRQLRAFKSSLTQQQQLHRETIARVDKLSALPHEIVVAFFATDPATASDRRLLLDEEVREIGQKIRLSAHRDAVKLESRWALRAGDILQYMNELNPTVVHFSGHGTDQDQLVLQDRNGNAAFVSLESIVASFEHFDSVQLVFFNTCHSFSQAAACTQHVNAAIGMNQEIGDTAARIFSSQFYSAIGFGRSIPEAFKQAKTALMLEGIPEHATPELHLREGVVESDLVLVKPKL